LTGFAIIWQNFIVPLSVVNRIERTMGKYTYVVTGSLMLTTEWSDWSNCNYYWIQSVYVRLESRHQGVFKELFDFAKTIAQSEGAGALRLYVDRNNINAQKVYQSLGMRESHYLMYEL